MEQIYYDIEKEEKMTLTNKIVNYLNGIEYSTDISKTSNSILALRYYNYSGVDIKVSAALFFAKMNNDEYPQYGSVVRGIRKARELHPRWKKLKKQKQIDRTKKEVGY